MAIELSASDKRNLTIVGVVLLVGLLVGLPIGMEVIVGGNQEENDALKSALAKVQEARPRVREWHERKDAVAQKYANKAPQLPTFLDEGARKQNMKPSDVTPRPDTPVGKGGLYTERRTDLTLGRVGMLPLAKFLEAIERSGFPMVISNLNIRFRTGEPDKYDVHLGVSAYDRVEKAAAGASEKDKPL